MKSKLSKVLKYCNRISSFTWKSFNKAMKCDYPCTETTYLSMLVHSGYVEKVSRGKYRVNITPSIYMGYNQLKEEAFGK